MDSTNLILIKYLLASIELVTSFLFNDEFLIFQPMEMIRILFQFFGECHLPIFKVLSFLQRGLEMKFLQTHRHCRFLQFLKEGHFRLHLPTHKCLLLLFLQLNYESIKILPLNSRLHIFQEKFHLKRLSLFIANSHRYWKTQDFINE